MPRPSCRYSDSTRKNDACPLQNSSWAASPTVTAARAQTARAASAACRPGRPAGAAGARTRRAGPGGHGERQPRPQRPAVRAALDQRQHDRGEAERSPAWCRRGPGCRPGLGKRRDSGMTRGAAITASSADRDVDEKAAAPAQPGRVGLDEDAADQLARHRGQAHAHAVGGQRLGAVGAVVEDADDATGRWASAAPRRSPGARRAMTRTSGVPASPHPAEASVNSASPAVKTRTRPQPVTQAARR